MLTVSLNNLYFHAFHGLYSWEQTTGGDFEVDVEVSFPEPDSIKDLTQTVDYEAIYDIVSCRMRQASALIEEVAQDCMREIHDRFSFVEHIEIRIRKLHPPLGGEVRHSQVILRKTF